MAVPCEEVVVLAAEEDDLVVGALVDGVDPVEVGGEAVPEGGQLDGVVAGSARLVDAPEIPALKI